MMTVDVRRTIYPHGWIDFPFPIHHTSGYYKLYRELDVSFRLVRRNNVKRSSRNSIERSSELFL
jgi:hypothetical protein